ncbi:MAG TPA: hypothetical protein DCO75_13505 [Fibrobacteres bacterium]|nr:hypothetical protein [Fibrobacterota bacterium]
MLSIFSIHAEPGTAIAVAVDASGSMRGFFTTHSLQDYVAQMSSRFPQGSCSRFFFFEKEIVPYADSPTRFGQSTYLDVAFNNLTRAGVGISIIITDNFQDTKT